SVLATAFAEVLAAWSGQPRMTLTVTLFDRRPVHPDVNAVVGDFTSLLLLECAPAPGDDWAGRARRLQTQMAADLEHSDVPATWVLREQARRSGRSEEHTSELQSRENLVCRLLLEKKK